MEGGGHCLCYCFKHKHFAMKFHPFPGIHTKYMFCLRHQEMVSETLLLAQSKVMCPDGWWPLQNFSPATTLLCQHAFTAVLGEGWYRLLFTQRNIVSWNRAGIICLELCSSSWMSPSLVKHGSGFTFYFPQWTVNCFLTDGGYMPCCQKKTNPIPCKRSLSDFSFPDGDWGKKKEQISQISEIIYYL